MASGLLTQAEYFILQPPAKAARPDEHHKWIKSGMPYFDGRISGAWQLYCSPLIEDDGIQMSMASQENERRRFACSPHYVAHINHGADKVVGSLWIDDIVEPNVPRDSLARIHIRVDNHYRGQGIGSQLIRLFLGNHPAEYESAQCVWPDRGRPDDPTPLFRRHGFQMAEQYGLNMAFIEFGK